MRSWLMHNAARVCEYGVFACCLIAQAALVMGGWALVVENLGLAP